MAELATLLVDLAAEAPTPTGWSPSWPASSGRRRHRLPGWTIAHQIAHLAWTDEQALLAATDPEAFAETLVAFAATDEPLGLTDREPSGWLLSGPPNC